MHDGGLLGSKLLDFVPGANFQVLQIISIIIIKRGVNITPPSTLLYTPLTSIFIFIGIAFFLFLYLLRPSPKTKWVAVFFVEIARKFDIDENLTNHKI